MKFTTYIEGEFTNVKGCLLVQRFEVELECGKCGKKKKNIRIDGDKTVDKEFSAKKNPARYNFTMTCECDSAICLKVYEPEEKISVLDKKGENEILVNPVKEGKCEIVDFWTEGAVVKGIDNVQLTVVAETLERYNNVDIAKRVVAEQSANNQCFIENFMLKTKQIN